ncbi:MAG: nitrous oxide reductase accessory protein NosL [Azospirillaceae bacterium]|nr:nitrous oxide reductase accessory protein NosL [Azospirillaceae bacterium]
MTRTATLLLVPILFALVACGPAKTADIPRPAPYDAQAKAHFCGMALGEHDGPKAQAWVEGQDKPYWFSSVHDLIAFTLLPEEPKSIQALYVTDMTRAPDWAHAQDGGWVDARKAVYVIDSDITATMGMVEEVPFGDRNAADVFARQHGGRVVGFDQIPTDNILGSATADPIAPSNPTP